MKTYHPIYGEMEIPDDFAVMESDLAITRELLAEAYHPVILAYQDMLESGLDQSRRKENV